MSVVQISHDPFARQSIYRNNIPGYSGRTCKFCHQPARFSYLVVPDDRNRPVHWTPPSFCSIGCWRSYNG